MMFLNNKQFYIAPKKLCAFWNCRRVSSQKEKCGLGQKAQWKLALD